MLSVLAGCSEPEEHASPLTDLSATSFKVSTLSASTCSDPELGPTTKVSPDESQLRTKIGSHPAELIVLMNEEIDLQRYPLPAGRDVVHETTPEYLARANAIAQSQLCALRALEAGGGEYLQSYVLINALSANLTAEQAIALSRRPDVRGVELAQTDESPP